MVRMVTSGPSNMRRDDFDPRLNAITGDIIDAAIEVQSHFGPGTYETMNMLALAQELRLRGRTVGVNKPLGLLINFGEFPLFTKRMLKGDYQFRGFRLPRFPSETSPLTEEEN